MKKLFMVLLILGLVVNYSFAAEMWKEGDDSDVVAGTADPSDIDTLLEANAFNPLQRLLYKYVKGCELTWTDADTITVGIGSVVCSNTAGTVHRMRENTATFTIDLSTESRTSGVEQAGDVDSASTWFYIFANGSADATTFTGFASTTVTPVHADIDEYYMIGAVYNDAGQDMVEFYQYDDVIWYAAGQQALNDGLQAAFTEVDVTQFFPPTITSLGYFAAGTDNNTKSWYVIHADGTAETDGFGENDSVGGWGNFGILPIRSGVADRAVDYKTSGRLNIYVLGYTINIRN